MVMRPADLGQCQIEVFNSWCMVFHLPASLVLVAREVHVETPPAQAPQELWGSRRHLPSCVAAVVSSPVLGRKGLDLFTPATKHRTLAAEVDGIPRVGTGRRRRRWMGGRKRSTWIWENCGYAGHAVRKGST